MPDASSSRRASSSVKRGRARADELAVRLGRALREARRAAGLTQAQVAERARTSQPRLSELERGHGAVAPLRTWAVVAAAVGEQLAAFLERASGASQPRDAEHLRRQELVLGVAREGGWDARPEAHIVAGDRPRSIDLLLVRRERCEAAVVEIWDFFEDVGGALRGTDAKVVAVAAELPGWRVRACWVVRGTRRNRAILRALAGLLRARFPGGGDAWLAALRRVDQAMPEGQGLLWTDVAGTALVAARSPGTKDRPGTNDRPGTKDRPGTNDRPGTKDRPAG